MTLLRVQSNGLAVPSQFAKPRTQDRGAVQGLLDEARPYYRKGKYAEAKPLLRQALSIREKSLGSEHPAVARSLNGLAVIYFLQGGYVEAEPLVKRAKAIKAKHAQKSPTK